MVKKRIKHGLMTDRENSRPSRSGNHEDHGERHNPPTARGTKAHSAGHQMGSDSTKPQLAALAGATSFLLVSGMVLPGFSVNLRLSARDVDASIMPPGMINTSDLSGEAMREMAAVKPRQVAYVASKDAREIKFFSHASSTASRWRPMPTTGRYRGRRQVGYSIEMTEASM